MENKEKIRSLAENVWAYIAAVSYTHLRAHETR